MADLTERKPENLPGRFYVDASCIDCDLCRELAPAVFRRHDESGQSFVHRQPAAAEEIALAEEAAAGCPTGSIGDDGPAGTGP